VALENASQEKENKKHLPQAAKFVGQTTK